jgi:methylglyoxal synthase
MAARGESTSHQTALSTTRRKEIALIAHDNKKADLIDWARFNRGLLQSHDLIATGTTGRMLGEELGLDVTCFMSGPLGGDQQIGGRIAEGLVDLLIFFWDPLEPQPHDTDVKALLRLAVVWNVPVACNRSSADFLISSPLLSDSYDRMLPEYATSSESQAFR